MLEEFQIPVSVYVRGIPVNVGMTTLTSQSKMLLSVLPSSPICRRKVDEEHIDLN